MYGNKYIQNKKHPASVKGISWYRHITYYLEKRIYIENLKKASGRTNIS